MECNNIKKNWDDYLQGKCSDELEQKINDHIQSCNECSEKLSLDVEKNEATFNKNSLNKHNISVKDQKRLLRVARWKQRFNTALSLFALIILLTIIGSILSGLYFTVGEKSKLDKAKETLTTMTEMTMPNMSFYNRNSNSTPFFTTKIEGNLSKRVGKDYQYPVGKLTGNLFFSMLNVERNWDSSGGFDLKLHFLNPHFNSKEITDDEFEDNNWFKLEKVKNGTVAEIAVTLDKIYSFEDAQKLLKGDFDLAWLAVDTGFTDNFSPYISSADPIWGLPTFPRSDVLSGIWDGEPDEYSKTEERRFWGFLKSTSESKTYTVAEPSETVFLNGLKFLKDNKKFAKSYPNFYTSNKFTKEIERIETYIDKHGINVYGLVITGPTEELLKLKNNDYIKYMSVGEIDWWNWDESNYGGTIHN